jgi:hypothetical protein
LSVEPDEVTDVAEAVDTEGSPGVVNDKTEPYVVPALLVACTWK